MMQTAAHPSLVLNDGNSIPQLGFGVWQIPEAEAAASVAAALEAELQAYHAAHGILTQSWSPLGQGTLLGNRVVQKIAAKHGKTAAQTIIRWHLDSGLLAIPKSVHAERLAENFAVFDFTLDRDDLARLAALDRAENRIGPHPDTADF
ncbi:MAG: aldo/keto reductase [Azoarcus sp.]|jgi:2,5-diketo-D-gluconate reductase A|nr:aldo/keto reductase [Azoarcus sp.]